MVSYDGIGGRAPTTPLDDWSPLSQSQERAPIKSASLKNCVYGRLIPWIHAKIIVLYGNRLHRNRLPIAAGPSQELGRNLNARPRPRGPISLSAYRYLRYSRIVAIVQQQAALNRHELITERLIRALHCMAHSRAVSNSTTSWSASRGFCAPFLLLHTSSCAAMAPPATTKTPRRHNSSHFTA